MFLLIAFILFVLWTIGVIFRITEGFIHFLWFFILLFVVVGLFKGRS